LAQLGTDNAGVKKTAEIMRLERKLNNGKKALKNK
jgi:hypothetical protein